MNGFLTIGSLLGGVLGSVDPNTQWRAAQQAAAQYRYEDHAIHFQEELYRQWLDRHLPVPVRERPSRIPTVKR